MKSLLKKVRIIAPESSYDGESMDILINEEGTIAEIGPVINTAADRTLAFDNAHLAAGLTDVGVQACDPGFEHQEDLSSAAAAAAAGGFTAMAVWPNTHPAIQTKSEVLYIRNQKDLLPDIYPIGALSTDCRGEEITEMMEMHDAGAVAFSDGLAPVQNGGLLMRALQYVRTFDGLIINQGLDQSISGNGQIHEGEISTMLGMRGIPSLAEEMMIQRDIQLTRYTNSRLHISNVSTAESVALIRRAKRDGIKVTASVAVLNLLWDHSQLLDFNTNLKTLPPLRRQEDINALKQGLKDGTIDFLSSNHVPLEKEEKEVEFPYAGFGALGLQTAFGASLKALRDTLSLSEIMERWTVIPRRILGLPQPKIQEGTPANLTLFDPDRDWVLEHSDILSRSHNSPFIGSALPGKILAVFNGNQSMVYSGQ